MHHYFGSKDQLFLATVDFPIDPGQLLPQVLAGGAGDVGERLVRTFLGVWDSPAGAAGAGAAALGGEQRVDRSAAARVPGHPGPAPGARPATSTRREAPLRGALVATQMVGLAMMRYILRLEPLASAPPDPWSRAIGPTIQRYLTGDIVGADHPGAGHGPGATDQTAGNPLPQR